MVSTISSAGWPTASMARRMSAIGVRAAGGGLVVHHAHRLDLAVGVGAQAVLDRAGFGAAAPVGLDQFRHQPKAGRHLPPQMGEPAGFYHQHPIAGREGVDQRRLHAPVPEAGWKSPPGGWCGRRASASPARGWQGRRNPARDGPWWDSPSRAERGRACWRGPGSAGNAAPGGGGSRNRPSTSPRQPAVAVRSAFAKAGRQANPPAGGCPAGAIGPTGQGGRRDTDDACDKPPPGTRRSPPGRTPGPRNGRRGAVPAPPTAAATPPMPASTSRSRSACWCRRGSKMWRPPLPSRGRKGPRVLPRGGGTSQCGQTVNRALVLDCSKHLRRILAIDPAARTATVASRASPSAR